MGVSMKRILVLALLAIVVLIVAGLAANSNHLAQQFQASSTAAAVQLLAGGTNSNAEPSSTELRTGNPQAASTDMQARLTSLPDATASTPATLPVTISSEVTSTPSPSSPSKPQKQRPRVILLCYFGLLKGGGALIENHETLIYKPLMESLGLEIRVLMHTYQMQHFNNPRNGENHKMEFEAWLSEWKERLGPKLLQVAVSKPIDADRVMGAPNRYVSHGDPWPENRGISMRYYLRQLYSLKTLGEMLRAATVKLRQEGYDVAGACFLRPDVLFVDSLPLRPVKFILTSSDDDPSGTNDDTPEGERNNPFAALQRKILIPSTYLFVDQVSDRFALGKIPAMLTYASRADFALEFSQWDILHAEHFLSNYLCLNNISIHVFPLRMHRWRLHGAVAGPDAVLDDQISLFYRRWMDSEMNFSKPLGAKTIVYPDSKTKVRNLTCGVDAIWTRG